MARAEEAQAALGTEHVWLHGASGGLAFFRGDRDEAQRHRELWLKHARATGDPYEVVSALSLLGAALLDDPARGTTVAEEAVRVARDAGLLSALPYALAQYLFFVGADDPDRELALPQEIIEVATALGDHRLVATVVAERESTKARHGDWPAALRATASAAAEDRGGGNMTVAAGTFRTAAIALTRLQRFEAGAVILGFADAHWVLLASEEYMTYLTAAEAAQLDALGEQRLAELKARGATLPLNDAIDYLCAEAGRALGE